MTTQHTVRRPSSPGIVNRIRKHQTAGRRSVAEILGTIFSTHLPTAYERELNGHLDWLFDTMVIELDRQEHAPAAQMRGGRALIVTGGAEVGKSWTLAHVLAARPELACEEADGEWPVVLSVVAPSPFTLGALGNEIVRRLGYDGSRTIAHSKVWPVVRELMAERGIRILHIDEAQHGDEIVGASMAQEVENTLKRMMQDDTWTIWLILSGLPSLARFCQADPSMRRRVRIVPFEPLRYPDDVSVVGDTLDRIGRNCPSVDCKSIVTDAFAHRLLHAAMGSYGILIEYVQDAIAECLTAGGTVLSIAHFADVYTLRTGVTNDHANVFVTPDWTSVSVESALYEELVDEKGRPAGQGLKTRKTRGAR